MCHSLDICVLDERQPHDHLVLGEQHRQVYLVVERASFEVLEGR